VTTITLVTAPEIPKGGTATPRVVLPPYIADALSGVTGDVDGCGSAAVLGFPKRCFIQDFICSFCKCSSQICILSSAREVRVLLSSQLHNLVSVFPNMLNRHSQEAKLGQIANMTLYKGGSRTFGLGLDKSV